MNESDELLEPFSAESSAFPLLLSLLVVSVRNVAQSSYADEVGSKLDSFADCWSSRALYAALESLLDGFTDASTDVLSYAFVLDDFVVLTVYL